MAFVFGGNTGLSYEEMLRQRDLATQLAGNVSRGGYTALGSGLASGLLARRADKAQKAGSAAAQEKAQSVLGMMFGQQVMGGQQGAGAQGASFDPSTPAPTDTLSLIKGFEGYSDKPYWDVNAHRAGYGSDTVTMSDGSVVPISPGMSVNRQDAERDLQRRVSTEFEPIAAKAAGAAWEGMAPNQRAALTSIAYNYGEIPKSVASALQTPGMEDDVAAIQGLASHNGGVNAKRRAQEAQVYAGTAGIAQTTMSAQNAPQQVGADPAALIAAMSDPYLDEGTRSILGQMFQAQIQKSDPSYQMRMQADQLALEKAQLELDQARNPKPGYRTLSKQEAQQIGLPDGGVYQVGPDGQIEILQQSPGGNTPAAFASLDLQARAAGFEPGTPEYQDFMRNGGGSGTPAAFTALDMQAKAAGLEPGTPEYQTFMATRGAGMAAEAKAKGEASAAAEIAAPADVATADRTLTYIDEVRKHPGLSMGTGVSSVFNSVPGTSGRDFDNRVKQLTSGAFLTAIDEMRGMGALSNAEGQTATAAVTRMDTSTSEEEFLAALKDYEDIVKLGRDRAASRIKEPAAQKDAGAGTTLTFNPQTGDFE